MSADPLYVPDEFEEGPDRPLVERGPRDPQLVDPADPDSDYLPGEWWDRKGGVPSRPLVAGRCQRIKTDGSRCRQWQVHGLRYCVKHSGYKSLPNVREIHEQTVHNARMALLQEVPSALSRIAQIIEDDSGEVPASVQLKASTEVLDRVGVRGGTEVDVRVDDVSDPGKTLAERLETLRVRAVEGAARTSLAQKIRDDDRTIVGNLVPEPADDQLPLFEDPL